MTVSLIFSLSHSLVLVNESLVGVAKSTIGEEATVEEGGVVTFVCGGEAADAEVEEEEELEEDDGGDEVAE